MRWVRRLAGDVSLVLLLVPLCVLGAPLVLLHDLVHGPETPEESYVIYKWMQG